MKITYMPNPLASIVELDAHEIEVFRLKLRIKEMEDLLFNAHFHMTYDKFIDHDKAKKSLDPDYYLEEDNEVCGLDKRVQVLLEHYLEELKLEHLGDCTCFAMSCAKCHAESILGIDTTKGLGKHPGYYIQAAFSRWNPETKLHDRPAVTLDEAILKISDPAASTWLKNYRDEHFAQGVGGDYRH